YSAALAASAVSVAIPSFIAPAALYIISTRYLVEHISGLGMSTLDIRYMLDMALYLSLFGILVVHIGPKVHSYFADQLRQTEVAFVAIGLHLANYFWSAIAKLTIGPHLWTWVLENHTYNSIPYTIVKGTLPIGQFPWLVQTAYDLMKFTVVPLNIAIVGFQL